MRISGAEAAGQCAEAALRGRVSKIMRKSGGGTNHGAQKAMRKRRHGAQGGIMGKRPLFLAALLAVLLTALWLEAGGAGRAGPGYSGSEEPEASSGLAVTGQVYQKDETSIYLKSVSLLHLSDAYGQSVQESGKKTPCKENLICETQQAAGIPLGSTVTLQGIYAPFSPASNPGEFDSAGYYRTLGIGGRIRKAEIVAVEEGYWPVREGLFRLKCLLRDRLYRILPKEDAAVMSALLLGDKKGLEDEVKDLYKRNGILHILSISSLHITIIGMSVYKLLRRMRMPNALAALAGSGILLLYGGMTGFGVSACRAIGMYLIKMLGQMTGRTYDMLTALGVMGALMTAVNPYYLHNSGFLLSFGSVLGIGALYPAILPRVPQEQKRRKEGKALPRLPEPFGNMARRCEAFFSALRPSSFCRLAVRSFFASLSVTLSTLPIQLWFYYEIPVYGVILNLFVIPFMKPMMIAGLLAMGVPGLGGLGIVNHVILEGYGLLCRCFDKLPFHTWNPGCPRPWQIAVYYLLLGGGAAACLYGKKKRWERKDLSSQGAGETFLPQKAIGKRGQKERRRDRAAGLIGAGLVLCGILVFAVRPFGVNNVIFLDVGQGDCVLVRASSGQTYLFDCGSTSRSGVGKYVLLPCLKYYGIRDIDAVFLSHSDGDHVNGALELFGLRGESGIKIGQLVLPAICETAREEQLGELEEAARGNDQNAPVPVGYLAAGESWDCGGAVFTCLHPASGYRAENPNEYSQCILAEFREKAGGGDVRKWSVLLTGDVEGAGEAALLAELQKRRMGGIAVLKVAHHGSKNSTSEAFLKQISPWLAVISCGRNNRYGHPHRELLERLEASGAYVLQTMQQGAVSVTYQNGSIRVRTWAVKATEKNAAGKGA